MSPGPRSSMVSRNTRWSWRMGHVRGSGTTGIIIVSLATVCLAEAYSLPAGIQNKLIFMLHKHDKNVGFLIQRHICVCVYSFGQSASQQLTAASLPHMFTRAFPSVRYQVSAAFCHAIPSLVSFCTHTSTHTHKRALRRSEC